MQSNGDEFQERISHAKLALTMLSQRMYDSADINAILAGIGTKTELFFKAVLFPTESPWRPFKYFINCLEDNISAEEIEELQAFRRAYNLSRHNPRFKVGVIQAQQYLTSLERVMKQICDLEIGNSAKPLLTSTKRVYWISAWEHIVGDDTEVHIIVPGRSEDLMGPPELDMIRIDSRLWEQAKTSLASSGRVDSWKGHIPEEYIHAWESLGDFIEAIAFEGEFRELLASLTQYEKYIEIMPGSNRSDCSHNVLVACLVAFVDVISAVPAPTGIVNGITRQVTSTYALPESAANLAEIAEELAHIAAGAWDDIQSLTGPLWASNEEFQELLPQSIVTSEKYPVLIDQNRRLIALHS